MCHRYWEEGQPKHIKQGLFCFLFWLEYQNHWSYWLLALSTGWKVLFSNSNWFFSYTFGIFNRVPHRLIHFTMFFLILVEDTVQKVQLWSSMALKSQQTEMFLTSKKVILVSTKKIQVSLQIHHGHSWSISDLLPKKSYTLPETNIYIYIDPESQWLEDDRFLLGPGVCLRAILVSGRVLPRMSFEK